MFLKFVCLAAILNLPDSVRGGVRLLEEEEEEDGELRFAAVVYRHGDRAPTGPYPTDPHGDAACWPNGWGQLTKLGELQQLELGRWLRNRYWDFIPRRYNASDIYARSTDVDRTLMSAYCNLAGLYESWDRDGSEFLPWQPVPVHTVPVEMDSVLAGHKKCPAYDRLLRELVKSEEVSSVDEYYRDVFANLSENSGLKIESVTDCVFLYSTLNIENLHGYRLPEWTKNFFPEPLKEISEFAFKIPCFTTPMKRLKCGSLVKDLVDRMEDKIGERITEKIWMYSGHDTTLANLMQCLNLYDGDIPPYAGTLIFELFRARGKHYVVLSYKTQATCRVLRMPRCDRICPLETFKSVLRPVIPADWEAECAKG